VPEPHAIRIFADVPGAKVLLDEAEFGSWREGSFSDTLPNGGPHKLKLMLGKSEVFSIEFHAIQGRLQDSSRLLQPVICLWLW